MFFFFLPYRIERPRWYIPWVTIAIIAVNIVVFASTAAQIDSMAQSFGFTMSPSGLYTWFTSMFLHGDLLHLLSNMFFLWLFGSFVEDALGRAKYLGLYAAGGLAAALLQGILTLTLQPGQLGIPMIGASGALAAVAGLFMVRFYRTRMRIAYLVWILLFVRAGVWRPTSLVGIGLWLANEVGAGLLWAAGAGDGVARWAHVGGLLCGAAVGYFIGATRLADDENLSDEAFSAASAGMHAEAAARFDELTARTGSDPDIIIAKTRAHLSAGTADSGVLTEFEQAIDELACSGRRERIVLANEELRRVLPQLPLGARTLSTMAGAADGQQRCDLAAELYWRIVGEHPQAPESERALFRLAHIYLASGMPTEAEQTWARFAATYPASQWLPYADQGFSRD
jgi:membrane associated rhomboid family serine protease